MLEKSTKFEDLPVLAPELELLKLKLDEIELF